MHSFIKRLFGSNAKPAQDVYEQWAGTPAHQAMRCKDCNQPMADHINGCPIYPPMGTLGVTFPEAARGVQTPDGGQHG